MEEYEACEGLPARMMLRKRMIVDALRLLLASYEETEEETEEIPQPPLPEMKNNDQRKEWLNNYRSWGVWYKDEHTGATYYRYQFENRRHINCRRIRTGKPIYRNIHSFLYAPGRRTGTTTEERNTKMEPT